MPFCRFILGPMPIRPLHWVKTHASHAPHAPQNRYNQNLRKIAACEWGTIMEFDLPQTISLLSHTPAALNALLRDLPEAWTLRNEGENTWSAFDVVAHLIYGERTDWIPRAKIILQFGETKAFEPFDRGGHIAASQGKSLARLLDEFVRQRSESLDQLRALNLQPTDLARRGRHPAFGPVTLSQHLASWAAHDLTHVHQISRIMAHQYREAVGPWRAYLGVLQCAGHSAP
jgi:DinB family protein